MLVDALRGDHDISQMELVDIRPTSTVKPPKGNKIDPQTASAGVRFLCCRNAPLWEGASREAGGGVNALFCATDTIAIGAIQYCRSQGLRVPLRM